MNLAMDVPVTTREREFSSLDARALRAIAVQFFVNGALFASFIPRLPEIRSRVGISVAGVGLLLSAAGIAGLLASALVSRVIARYGTRVVMLAAGTLVSVSLPIVGLATTPIVLLVGLVGMMTFDVPVDVAMNMQGSWLSARRHAPVMNRLHGLWSLGTVVGGISSSRIAAVGIGLSTHLLLAGAVLLAVLGYVGRGILRVDELHGATEGGRPDGARPETATEALPSTRSPMLILFVLVGFFAVAIESTSIDWASFRLADDFGASAGVAALGYVAVTAGMTIGRFAGDWATTRLGAQRLTNLALTLTGLGLAAASLPPVRLLSLAGYFVAGVGIATLLPMLYDAAAKHHGRPGAGLGALSAGLRSAGLTIPVIVGALAATRLSVGSAVAIVTLPSVVGFLAISVAFRRAGRGRP